MIAKIKAALLGTVEGRVFIGMVIGVTLSTIINLIG